MKLNKHWKEHPSTLNPGMQYYIHATTKRVVRYCRLECKWFIFYPTGTKYPVAFQDVKLAMKVAEQMPIAVKKT